MLRLVRYRIQEFLRKGNFEAAIVPCAMMSRKLENGGEVGPLLSRRLQTQDAFALGTIPLKLAVHQWL